MPSSNKEWYADKLNKQDVKEIKAMANKENNVVATKIINISSIIRKDTDFRDLNVKNSPKKLEALKENFPYYQIIKGDGLCGLHSIIVGILAKCADNNSNLKDFRKNLENYPSSIKDSARKSEAQQVIKNILKKIPQNNLTFDKFYELVSEKSEENISKQLATILFKNADFETAKQNENQHEKKVREEDYKMQQEFLTNPNYDINISNFALRKIIKNIAPKYEVKVVNAENLEEYFNQTDKNAIYLLNYETTKVSHFDLLYSKSETNLIKAVLEKKQLAAKSDLDNKKLKNHLNSGADEIKVFNSSDAPSEISTSNKKIDDIFESITKKTEDLKSKLENVTQPKVEKLGQKSAITHQKNNNILLIKNFEKFEGKQEAVKELISVKNKEIVFENKLYKAIGKIQKLTKESSNQKNNWKSLTNLDRRVLVDFYNANNSVKIDFNSLFRNAKIDEKPDLSVQGENFVFDETKTSDLKDIINYSCSVKIPSTFTKKLSANRISKDNILSSNLNK